MTTNHKGIYVCGFNEYCQLSAISDSIDKDGDPCILSPVQMNYIDPNNLLKLSLGGSQSVFITKNHEAFGSGNDINFLIGFPTPSVLKSPEKLTFSLDISSNNSEVQKFNDVHCGSLYTIYLVNEIQLVYVHRECRNRKPAFFSFINGNNNNDNSNNSDLNGNQNTKSKNSYIKFISVSGSQRKAAAIDMNGDFYIFSDTDPYKSPKKVHLKEPIMQISCGEYFTAVLSKTGKVYGNGQLNCDLEDFRSVSILAKKNTVQISSTHNHIIALTDDGAVYAWGSNSHCQLGRSNNDDDEDFSLEFIQIPYFIKINQEENIKIVEIYGGCAHSLFLADSGSVYGCGMNGDGQLMTGNMEDQFNIVESEFKHKVTHMWPGNSGTAVLVGMK